MSSRSWELKVYGTFFDELCLLMIGFDRGRRLAFPDAPPPGAPEMINYMRVGVADIVAAAEKMVRG